MKQLSTKTIRSRREVINLAKNVYGDNPTTDELNHVAKLIKAFHKFRELDNKVSSMSSQTMSHGYDYYVRLEYRRNIWLESLQKEFKKIGCKIEYSDFKPTIKLIQEIKNMK